METKEKRKFTKFYQNWPREARNFRVVIQCGPRGRSLMTRLVEISRIKDKMDLKLRYDLLDLLFSHGVFGLIEKLVKKVKVD